MTKLLGRAMTDRLAEKDTEMGKVRLEHKLLDSKIATAAALLNEWLKWCDKNGIKPYAIPHIMQAFNIRPEDYRKEAKDEK